jgi:hypothetical protein
MGLLLAEETPASGEGYGESSLSGTYTGFAETTYDDPNWALVISDLILRNNYCSKSGLWFEKVFEPCYWIGGNPQYNRYWKIVQGSITGRAFTMEAFGDVDLDPGRVGTFDSLYVREEYGFQLYYNTTEPNDPNELLPASPYLVGPKYVSLDHWFSLDPDGFEPGTFFVVGGGGDLKLYSIIIYANPLSLEKTYAIENGYDCVSPVDANKDQITYTISYGNPITDENHPYYIGTVNDVNITDYLDKKIDFGWASGPNSNYESGPHRVRWEIGNLEPGQSGSVTLGVTVNELAEPVGIIRNLCDIGPNSLFVDVAETNVCCWNPGVIYVDGNASDGLNTGMSWEHAYLDLQSALNRASACFSDEIKVAKGAYTPSVPSGDPTFTLVDSVKMYGGYPSGGGQRDWTKNETVLLGNSNYNYAVTASQVGSGTIIDGFTVRNTGQAGIYCNQADPVISHVQLIWNAYNGLYCVSSSSPTVTNCVVHHNPAWGGIYCVGGSAVIRNNTIVNNSGGGISFSGGSPSISNCIVWGNGNDLDGCSATYSCIEDNDSGQGNIHSNPHFVYEPNNNYHLRFNSPCIDTGDSNVVEANETDIDGYRRLMDGDGNGTYIVDRGASEYCNSPADFDDSCDVDLFDYAIFVSAWKSTDSNSNYNEKCDLWDDNTIDYKDLGLFCDEWLYWMCRDKDLIMAMSGGGCDGLLGGEGLEFSQETFGFEDTETAYEPEPALAPEMDPNAIEEMIEWLDEMWNSGVFKDVMTEEEYLEFRKLVLESGGY